MDITIDDFNQLLAKKNIGIVATAFREHSKASEKYVDVIITHPNHTWEGSIPYFYRRTGLFIEEPEELVAYLEEIYPYFSKKNIDDFKIDEKKRWNDEFKGKKVTKPFFDILINLEWNSAKYDLPKNDNWQRRIQDIKELGYTLATRPRTAMGNHQGASTYIMLIPMPKGGTTGYEIMSESFKKQVIKALKSINIYELSSANTLGLIPDHKFPEIRWDKDTKAENPENMSEEEMKGKFQLLDNQRNQQKREVCRKCFQSNKRGVIFGINHFYEGNENWDSNIPKTGKEAEKGCIGCAWYDIEAWRASLNKLISENT